MTPTYRTAGPGLLPLLLAAALSVSNAGAAELKSYDTSKPSFWTNPPPDWFLSDETEAQQGLAPKVYPATPTPADKLEDNLRHITLPTGFKIEVYASGIPQPRQMAWGANGTLFVGSFQATNVYAVTDQDGKRTVRTIITGLNMPTGVAFWDGSLYVIAINRLLRYENAEASLDKITEPVVVYDDMPPYPANGWKYLVTDKNGWMYIPVGPPFNIGIPPTSTAQIRHVDSRTGLAEIVALGVRTSVGGDIDPRSGDYWFTENARDWLSDDTPSDKLNHITRLGENFGYPHCHQGNLPDPEFALGHKCTEFTAPVINLGAHVAPLGMKFYTGSMFPPEYKNNIFIAEHGSWNRHTYQGGRIERVIVSPEGKNPRQEAFASGWITGDREYIGRPDDVIQAPDGSLLVSDDWAGAIYRISYSKK